MNKFLRLGVFVAGMLGMVSCLKSVDSQDDKKIAENEAAIEKYIVDNSLTDKVVRETNGIIYYKERTNPAGATPQTGDEASVKMVAYLLDGTKAYEPKDSIVSFPVDGFATQIGGLELGVKLLKTGEKGSFLLPYYYAFGTYSTSTLPAYSPVRMEIELVKLRSEVKQIEDYVKAKEYKVSEVTINNLYLVRTNEVAGDTLGSGKSVTVKYVGKTLNGATFDEGTLTHTTNASNTILGFDRAIRKMRVGEKAIAIFPSALGYGKTGVERNNTWVITPYQPLVFELEIVK